MAIIIDTDPGIDDMLAIMLLLAAPKSKAELKLISLSFGNCSLKATLVNVLSLFHIIQKDGSKRKQQGISPFTDQRPMLAMGADRTIEGVKPKDATDVHGSDGLGGSHKLYPEYTCPSKWVDLYSDSPSDVPSGLNEDELPFIVNRKPSHEVILDILRSEPEGTVTICAVGPLTNCALAAEADPVAFSRVKEVLSMGAAINVPGNVTPEAEFNVFADAVAAARIYALTSPKPEEMMPANSPESLLRMPKPLNLILFPLDLTTEHNLTRKAADKMLDCVIEKHPDQLMPGWAKKWIELTLENMKAFTGTLETSIQLHDPLTAEYAIDPASGWEIEYLDVRVESGGQWCLGKTVIDRRGRLKTEKNEHDFTKWVTIGSGNNVGVAVKAPYDTADESFGLHLLKQIVMGLE